MVELLFGSVVDRGIVEDLNKDSRGLTLPTSPTVGYKERKEVGNRLFFIFGSPISHNAWPRDEEK